MSFVPPDAKCIAEALGDISKLPRDMEMAVTNKLSESFQSIPEPHGCDWLIVHEEKGQTMKSFEQMAYKAVPRATFKTIYIQPVGSFDHPRAGPLDIIIEFARVFFSGCQVELLPKINFSKDMISRKLYGRIQYLTDSFFDYLSLTRHKRNIMRELVCVAVTMADIYPEDSWNFVYGQAHPIKSLGVYSFARLDPLFLSSEKNVMTCPFTDEHRIIMLRRCVSTLLHELGHLFGLLHCIYYVCLMNGANHEIEMDGQPLYLCPVCLRKLYSTFRFNVRIVYEKFADLCETYGLEEECIWYRKRLDCIKEQ
ncbi:unnamed protein product [Rotaria magnacalcarata]|uniref:Archaemetzincin-2 n=1 Tax=Rotaria magnacalcarata TaxID=392030 RepID=A0A816DNC3_9BILA|nr:unnamed protein product [Rotaria magnacalcarata]CAF1640978.1 unnamed protein product [Rotaria magnacalcarata]CAF2134135.1 unnamed protein product [Rotaria magnacalcarata]CAF2216557.1 unnamed protein product [Rotaria magnacalcarata]CAF3849451.1 unnamed protein product [Rotaria magnacalcarata]